MVYEDAEKLYTEVRKDGKHMINEAFKALFPSSPDVSPGQIVAYNTTFFPRRDVVKIPLSGNGSKLRSQVVQASKDGSYGYALMDGSNGGHVARPTGLFADCLPASGRHTPSVLAQLRV